MTRAIHKMAVLAALSTPLLLPAGKSVAKDGSPHPDRAAVVVPFITDDTFLVGYVNVAGLRLPDGGALAERLASLGAVSPEAKAALGGLVNAAKSLQSAGVEGIYLVVGLGDLYLGGGPVVVASRDPDSDAQAIENMLTAGAHAFEIALAGPLRSPVLHVARHPSGVLLIGQQPTLDRYLSAVPSGRPDLVKSLARLIDAGADLAIVDSAGPDCRRVLRELWPELPPPLAPVRGELADRWLRFELSANFDGEVTAQLAMQASDKDAAELFVQMFRALPEASRQWTENAPHQHALQRTLQTIVEAVPTRIEDTRVVMTLPTDEAQIAKLRGLMSEAGDSAMESAYRQQRMRQFKQLALAMHNFADKNKHLPPAAICNENGKPLLSWRVAVLPWVEERELYDQFHLDEPWDSPHNRTLVDKMPDVYADPSPTIRRLAGEGKTTFVVPAGPGTVFDRPEGTTFKEITDGTSKTIMIVEVPPQYAVEWTKPEDWDVDLEHPRRGFEWQDRDYIVTISCDGAAHVMPADIKPEVLRAFLTLAGDEVVDWP